MIILVLNCGSSSLKYRVIDMPSERELAGGEAQRVGPPTAEPSRIAHRQEKGERVVTVEMKDHATAFEHVMRLLQEVGLEPEATGHRVVHGGPYFTSPAVMDDASLTRLEQIGDMAPLHNPPATALIRSCSERYPSLPQVAVFDTAFHATIPDYARAYALPEAIREDMGIRKYGFHGTSHQFVAEEAAAFLRMPFDRFRGVTCHLGSGGASLCAIVNGRSVDNTMGYSPLQGLVMSTRCGDADPTLALRLLSYSAGDDAAVEAELNRRSGVLGLSGLSADVRDVLAAMENDGDPDRLKLAAHAYVWRIRRYLGAYLAVVGPAHAVVFTDTIGETCAAVRRQVCADMSWFGLEVDTRRNRDADELPADVATADSQVRILAVRTNEELAIARRVYERLCGSGKPKEKAA